MPDVRRIAAISIMTFVLTEGAVAGPCARRIAAIDTEMGRLELSEASRAALSGRQNNRMAASSVATVAPSQWQYANRHAAQQLLAQARKLDMSGDQQCAEVLYWRDKIPLN